MVGSRHATLGLAALAVSLGAAPVWAQRWGSGRPPRDGACFYRHADYEGDYFCLRAGESSDSLPSDMNNSISSIRFYGRAEVLVFRETGFRGTNKRFEQDVSNLRHGGWNDQISSLQVRGEGGVSGADADRIVYRAYRDLLGREPDQAGLRTYRRHVIDDGWSEKEVREALKKSPEYRENNAMTLQKAEEIVRRAYQSVLRRDPDPGSHTYVNRVMRDRWTQADVERELRKSPEYRNR